MAAPLPLYKNSLIFTRFFYQRTVNFDFALRQKTETLVVKDGNYLYEILIESETSIKENGYLAAGVSKIDNGDSLVLVMNAEIK
jgi:hypothetical protein